METKVSNVCRDFVSGYYQNDDIVMGYVESKGKFCNGKKIKEDDQKARFFMTESWETSSRGVSSFPTHICNVTCLNTALRFDVLAITYHASYRNITNILFASFLFLFDESGSGW